MAFLVCSDPGADSPVQHYKTPVNGVMYWPFSGNRMGYWTEQYYSYVFIAAYITFTIHILYKLFKQEDPKEILEKEDLKTIYDTIETILVANLKSFMSK